VGCLGAQKSFGTLNPVGLKSLGDEGGEVLRSKEEALLFEDKVQGIQVM